MFEEWFMWQIEIMIEDNPFVTGNEVTNAIMDYYMDRWYKRIILLNKVRIVLNA